MDAVFGVFRGFMGPDTSEQEKQLDFFRGLFGGMPTDAVKRFVNDLEERAVRQRHDVVQALREASEQKYAAAQRRGVRNPNAPSPAELQHPAWSEFNIVKDAHARGQKLLQLQDRAVKMLLEFSGREEEFLPAPLRRVSSAREEEFPPVRRASNVREQDFQTPLRRISSAQEDPSPDPELVRALPVTRQNVIIEEEAPAATPQRRRAPANGGRRSGRRADCSFTPDEHFESTYNGSPSPLLWLPLRLHVPCAVLRRAQCLPARSRCRACVRRRSFRPDFMDVALEGGLGDFEVKNNVALPF
jgi:hypothetical protein